MSTLRSIVEEPVKQVRVNVMIDWTVREEREGACGKL